MNVAVPGANWSLCAEAMDQAVVPATGLPSPPVQVKAVPPHSSTSIPRCRLYQACSAGASLALKKMPPMPLTRFMPGILSCTIGRAVVERAHVVEHQRQCAAGCLLLDKK